MIASHSIFAQLVEALEPRRLLSLAPVGAEAPVAAPAAVKSYELSVAPNGSSIVASIEDPAAPRLTIDDIFSARNSIIDQLFGDGGNDSATADSSDVRTSIETPHVSP